MWVIYGEKIVLLQFRICSVFMSYLSENLGKSVIWTCFPSGDAGPGGQYWHYCMFLFATPLPSRDMAQDWLGKTDFVQNFIWALVVWPCTKGSGQKDAAPAPDRETQNHTPRRTFWSEELVGICFSEMGRKCIFGSCFVAEPQPKLQLNILVCHPNQFMLLCDPMNPLLSAPHEKSESESERAWDSHKWEVAPSHLKLCFLLPITFYRWCHRSPAFCSLLKVPGSRTLWAIEAEELKSWVAWSRRQGVNGLFGELI